MTIMPQWGVFVRLIVSDASMGQGCRTIRGTAGGRTPSNDDDGSDEHNRDADRHPVWVNLNLSAARLPVLGLRVVWPVHGLRPSRRPGHGTTLDPLHLDETSRRVGIQRPPHRKLGTDDDLRDVVGIALHRGGRAACRGSPRRDRAWLAYPLGVRTTLGRQRQPPTPGDLGDSTPGNVPNSELIDDGHPIVIDPNFGNSPNDPRQPHEKQQGGQVR